MKSGMVSVHRVEGCPDEATASTEPSGDVSGVVKNDAKQSGEALESKAAMVLLGALGEAVLLTDQDGQLIWANPYFYRLTDEIRRRVLESSVQAAGQARAVSTGSQRGPVACKYEIESKDRSRVFDVYATTGEIEDEADGGLAVVVRDVTVQRRTQRKMDAIDRAGYELARFDADEIRRMNSYERLQLLEQKIIEATRELLEYDHFAIFVQDRKAEKLQLVISEGLPEEIEDLDLVAGAEGNGISGHVAATGESYICYDATTDEMYIPGLKGARSSLTVPLRVHDRVIGIMDIESKEPGQFDEQDMQFVEIFARHIAMALHLLDLLVAERCDVNQSVSGRFEGELAEPLEDLEHEVDWFRTVALQDPEAAAHVKRLADDVESIKRRMRQVAEGPQTLLGLEKHLGKRKSDPVLAGRKVLVADDHAKIRKVIGELLSHRGAEVTVCDGGTEAIAALQRYPGEFDLVVSDIQMPDRNGYEVFSACRKFSPNAAVILMTGFGYDPHHSIVRASQEGLHGVLFKPFEIDLLLESIRQALTSKFGDKASGKPAGKPGPATAP